MHLIGRITVTAVLPEKLLRLRDIAYNLWWSWNNEATRLFKDIDSALWEKLGNNPVGFLQEVSQKKLDQKADDEEYLNRYNKVIESFDSYISNKDTWFSRNHPDKSNYKIAYFSAEYGLSEVLPVYSGGLGVLSGDHCKSASDLGLPFTAVGLFYKQGYFRQHINREGWQETKYPDLNISQLPVTAALNDNGEQICVSIELPGRIVYARVWLVKVGRINLYLLDTDVDRNNPDDRWLTSRLYGGDQETRIQQEILLGIGGFRALEALGINAAVYHMNEGHSAFLGLELVRKLVMEKCITFKTAKEIAASSIVFTTHTPVPAGNDVFPVYMIDKYFSSYWDLLGISRHEFLDLGLKIEDTHNFNMTVLALNMAGRKNGVSELHGAVSRNIFNNVWPGIPEDEVPISHITNGIHTLTWLAPVLKKIYDKYLGIKWYENLEDKDTWNRITDIPDEELWNTHYELKVEMIDFIRHKIKTQRIQNGESPQSIQESETILNPDALTIGFARRFATYKRADLIFRNIARIQRILNNPERPLQIVFAGKAHPADGPAHEIIKRINDIAKQEGFKGKVILIENYNMNVAKKMVQGVDIWLNNPKRPLEASGTSGQKVCINGIINFSILDGWWCEGYNGKNGWAIGSETSYENEYYQDEADSESMYDILESQIIPLFYKRDAKGIPKEWIEVMKESIKSLGYQFNTNRMVQEYTSKMYIPSINRVNRMAADDYTMANQLAEWKSFIHKNWSQVHIEPVSTMNYKLEQKVLSGQPLTAAVFVNLGPIDPSSIKVELYYGSISDNNAIEDPEFKEMVLVENPDSTIYKFTVDIILQEGGEYGYTFRTIPYHAELINKLDMGLIKWAIQ